MKAAPLDPLAIFMGATASPASEIKEIRRLARTEKRCLEASRNEGE